MPNLLCRKHGKSSHTAWLSRISLNNPFPIESHANFQLIKMSKQKLFTWLIPVYLKYSLQCWPLIKLVKATRREEEIKSYSECVQTETKISGTKVCGLLAVIDISLGLIYHIFSTLSSISEPALPKTQSDKYFFFCEWWRVEELISTNKSNKLSIFC